MGAAERAAATAASAPARHPLVVRVLAAGAPEALRLSAARGALPIPVADLVDVQVRLLADTAPAVVAAARETLGRMGPETLSPILRDPHCAPEVLDHFARSGALPSDLLAAVIAHPAVPDAALVALASYDDPAILNLLVTNETRVIGHPPLLQALRANPRLLPENRRRIAELEQDFIGKTPLHLSRPGSAAGSAGPSGPAVPSGPAAPAIPAAEAVPAPPDATDGMEPPPDGTEEAPVDDPAAEQYSEEELQRTDAYQRIMRLNVAERNLLAMKGGSEERAILIRDTAKVVSMAVLKNPRLSDNEIAIFSGMRNLHEDILRVIAQSRDWTKTYAVVLNLVRNPKTPPGLSIQFLARLGTRDLKITAGDKNIPELVRRNARNLYLARTQPAKKSFKKAH